VAYCISVDVPIGRGERYEDSWLLPDMLVEGVRGCDAGVGIVMVGWKRPHVKYIRVKVVSFLSLRHTFFTSPLFNFSSPIKSFAVASLSNYFVD
jgi:hypothetical protein